MSDVRPFQAPNSVKIVTATTTSAATAMATASGDTVRVVNYSSTINIRIQFDNSTVVANNTASGTPSLGVPFGQTETFTIPITATHFAVITDSSTAVVEVGRSCGL